MKLLILLASLALSLGAAAAESPCNYYLEKADALGCDDSNYLVRFGYRYCRKFEKRDREFSSRARPVLSKLRLCLIGAMESRNPRCESTEKIGYASHVDCYVSSGFCDLRLSDKTHILWHVRGEFFNPKFRKAANRILGRCNNRHIPAHD